MPSHGVQDRVQPSLIDRLTDDDPQNRSEARDHRMFSMSRLREAVLRDLSWLLNASDLATTQELEEYPHVASSVLNFGVPPLTGLVKEGIDATAFARQLLVALRRFEPRLLPETIRVSLNRATIGTTAFQFIIEADLWAQPVPLRMLLRTELDRDLDMVRVVEQQQSESG
jgi:type VI secretion system protein ImpF